MRFLLVIGVFIAAVVAVEILASEDDFLVYYQPIFFLFTLSLPLLLIGYCLEKLREPDPFPQAGFGKYETIVPISPKGLVSIGRGVLKLYIAASIAIILIVLPQFGAAMWRLLRHLL